MHNFDIPVHTRNCIFEPYLDPHQEIGTGLGAGPSLPPPKEIKDIAKAGEISGAPATAEPTAPGIGAFGCIRVGLVTHIVVLAFFLLVGQDAVGFVDLLELILGPMVLADIRMEFAGEAAVGFLDLCIVGIPGYAERFVVVLSAHDPFTRLLLCSLH
jgi:hypothetical protein